MNNFDESLTLAAALRRRRAELGHSQRDAALILDSTFKNIAIWESGSIPTAQFFQAIQDYLDIERAQLGLLFINSAYERAHLLSLRRAN
jgi:transcriptional regulator with XRE-family HTH domain